MERRECGGGRGVTLGVAPLTWVSRRLEPTGRRLEVARCPAGIAFRRFLAKTRVSQFPDWYYRGLHRPSGPDRRAPVSIVAGRRLARFLGVPEGFRRSALWPIVISIRKPTYPHLWSESAKSDSRFFEIDMTARKVCSLVALLCIVGTSVLPRRAFARRPAPHRFPVVGRSSPDDSGQQRRSSPQRKRHSNKGVFFILNRV